MRAIPVGTRYDRSYKVAIGFLGFLGRLGFHPVCPALFFTWDPRLGLLMIEVFGQFCVLVCSEFSDPKGG